MGLVMSVIFIEGIVQVTIDPRKLRNMTKVEWHLGIFSWLIIILLSKRVHFLIQVGMHDTISCIVPWLTLMPEVLWSRGRVKVKGRHYLSK